ncbi:unnamed protein product, partial [Polarella glacialis]
AAVASNRYTSRLRPKRTENAPPMLGGTRPDRLGGVVGGLGSDPFMELSADAPARGFGLEISTAGESADVGLGRPPPVRSVGGADTSNLPVFRHLELLEQAVLQGSALPPLPASLGTATVSRLAPMAGSAAAK